MKQRLVFLNNGTPLPFDLSKGEAGLPLEFPVLKWGENQTAKGRVIVNETTVRELAAYNAAMNWDRPYLDFEHNTIPESPTFRKEPALIAAPGQGFEVGKEKGLVIKLAAYTPEGKQFAGGGHYRDVSAVVICNEQDEVIGFHSAALCRHGAAKDMEFFSAPWGHSAEKRPPSTGEELLSAMRDMLGLGNEATPATVLRALSTIMKTDDPSKKTGEVPEEMKTLTAGLTQATEALKTLSAEVKALKGESEAGTRAEIAAQCAREGKVLPAMAKDLPIPQLKALAAELPVTVPLEQRTPPAGAVLLHANGASEDDAISKLTGVTKEMREKYGSK